MSTARQRSRRQGYLFFIGYPIGMILLVLIHPAIIFTILAVVTVQNVAHAKETKRLHESSREITERDLDPFWVDPS